MNWIERLNCAPGRIPLDLNGGSAPAGVEVRHWAYSPHLPDNVSHRHAYYEVCLVGEHGTGQYIVEGVPHPLTPGTLFFARPGILHQIVNTAAAAPLMELFWVTFTVTPEGTGETAALLRSFAQAENVRAAAAAAVPDNQVGVVWAALRVIAGSNTGNAAGQAAQITALMSALLLGIVQAGAEPSETLSSPEKKNIRNTVAAASLLPARLAIQHIHDNLSEPLVVGEIAGRVGVSTRHLARLFAQLTGVAPAAYIEKARLERARTLLLRTDDPIKQVASHCGYPDIHHFTRVFARRFGCPPGVFRKRGEDSSRSVSPAEGELV